MPEDWKELRELRERAYRAWIDCGQNLSEAQRSLENSGYVISRKSLQEWKAKYDWPGRAARAEAEARRIDDAVSEPSLIDALVEQKNRYEQYFQSLQMGKVDNQATFAYAAILKAILDMRDKAAKSAPEPMPEILVPIKTPEDAIAAIREALEIRVNRMLGAPEKIAPAALKQLKESFEFLEKMASKYRSEEPAEAAGISCETIDRIRKEIMGV